MDKRTIAERFGDKKNVTQPIFKWIQMDKKVAKSKKYDHVESSLKTGRTVKDVEILSKNIFKL